MPQLTVHAAFGPVASFAVWTCVCLMPCVAAEPVLSRHFNGPETSWQILDADDAGRVLVHECVPGGARDRAGLERTVVAAPGGHSVLLTCPTASVAIIDELEVRIWVKASRPDVQLAARVALPRTLDHHGHSAATVIVRGAKYDRPGHWQQLVLNDVPKLLAAQIRVMRSAPGVTADSREAFINAIVLAVPGDPQGVEVETDDLIVDGVLRSAADEVQLTSYPSAAGNVPAANGATPTAASLRRLPDATLLPDASTSESSVRLEGDLLLMHDRPFVPRAIQWQGEPLQFLSERGFNVVWLDRPPTAEQVAEATRHALWFICLPPRAEALARDGLGRPGDRVIAWYLEDEAIESDPNYARRWAELVRDRDAVAGRPIIMAPIDWNAASKTADILLARRSRLGLISAADYDGWLVGRSPLARPGTPIWSSIPTQFDQAVGRQIAALSGIATAPPNIDAEQIESLVQTACMRGVRGFVFDSQSSLIESDAATRLRATTLELINRRLQMIEPWLAAGNVIGRIPAADAAWTGVVLHVDRARLLIPVAEPVAPKSNATEAVFVVPGVPESCQVFQLSSAALRTLPMQRVAGGVRLAMRPDDDSFILMTEDPQVIQSLRQRIARDGARIIHLERDRAARSAASIAAAEQRRSIDVSAKFSSNPLALSPERLIEFATFQRTYAALRGGENLLYGGDFEDLGQLTHFGWQHLRDEVPGVESRAELSTVDPRHGNYCLELHARATAPDNAQPTVDGAAVWIQSPLMPVAGGQWIEIIGWVRIDAPIIASDEGLQIVDSLGGPELSLALDQTTGWQSFQMIRAVPESTELRLTFALTGLGSARIDAVMIRTLEQPTGDRLPSSAAARDNAIRQ